MPAHKQDVGTRFWAKVDKSGDCWLWTGLRSKQGYGKFYLEGRTLGAHRVALALSMGLAVPVDDLWTLHHCDNPPCVNPAHLYLGTPSDNVRDMVVRRRQPRGNDHWTHREPQRLTRGDDHWTRRDGGLAGERNGRAKLTAQDVADIRAAYAAEGGPSQSELGRRYGVTQVQISSIIRRKAWAAA